MSAGQQAGQFKQAVSDSEPQPLVTQSLQGRAGAGVYVGFLDLLTMAASLAYGALLNQAESRLAQLRHLDVIHIEGGDDSDKPGAEVSRVLASVGEQTPERGVGRCRLTDIEHYTAIRHLGLSGAINDR